MHMKLSRNYWNLVRTALDKAPSTTDKFRFLSNQYTWETRSVRGRNAMLGWNQNRLGARACLYSLRANSCSTDVRTPLMTTRGDEELTPAPVHGVRRSFVERSCGVATNLPPGCDFPVDRAKAGARALPPISHVASAASKIINLVRRAVQATGGEKPCLGTPPNAPPEFRSVLFQTLGMLTSRTREDASKIAFRSTGELRFEPCC